MGGGAPSNTHILERQLPGRSISHRGRAAVSSPIAELAAQPEAVRWARDCAWVPGTGYCRNRPCGAGCLFRAQREAEALRVTGARRRRRSQMPELADRLFWRVAFVAVVSGLTGLA